MKKLLMAAVLVFLTFAACAQQDQGVKFHETSMAELLELSKNENKPIFLDVYAVWCGPCKYMAENVFPQKVMGDYFSARFINAKIDAEKGEGIDVARKYVVNAYPTFLILDSDGNEIARMIGGDNPENFIAKIDELMKNR